MTQEELTNRLNAASIKYYRGEESEFSDTEFDLKLKELQKMEKESGYVYPNSPTQRVGSDIQNGFGKVSHPFPMLTIENTYTKEGVVEWAQKMFDTYGVKSYEAGIKYDGISCELRYVGGRYISSSTRGNKMVGDDITLNTLGIKDIPFNLKGFDEDEEFFVRGEILMPKSVLERLNEEREANCESKFANTRNACAGSVKQLDYRITAKRGLIFRPWDCFGCRDFKVMTEKIDFLKRQGFKIEYHTVPFAGNPHGLGEFVEKVKADIDSLNLDYDYDGVVIKVNDMAVQNKIGTKDTRAIEWGIARKWNEQYEVWTELLGVDWQVGRTGVVTPVGILEPVECNGVTISNVTLHNVDFIKNSDLHIYNDLKITRSGGVIPYVLECKHDLLMEWNGVYPVVKVPEVCPVCSKPLVMDGALLKCVNENCPAIIKGKILQFCSKEGADIKCVGEQVVNDLYEKGLIKSIEDILSQAYRACINDYKENDIKQWVNILGVGYGEKSVRNIMDSLAYARLNTPYEKILAGLSIPGVGKTMARVLAKKYDDVSKLSKATVEELMTLDGIAETSATAIYNWIWENAHLLSNIDNQGWNWKNEGCDEVPVNKVLEGLNVVFSGLSNRFKGDGVEEYLESFGAKCGHSVSKKTNYLIIGDKPGQSKVNKANELGVIIISEDDFFDKFKF